MKKLLLSLVFLFTCYVGYSQTVITDEDFDKKVTNGDAFGDEDYSIIVVEFWASFNDGNAFKEWDKLEGCKYYRVDISKAPRAKKEHSVRTIPHIIIFKDGEDSKHFKAGIGFTLDATLEEIQEVIDELLQESKF
tara:strand:- start:345 stop:749 length:405 start_codon:yes stop_codon:yes gene_type:complete